LQVVNHVISVKKDSTSESFLSVSENGVKVSGIQDAINAATSGKAESSVVSALNDVVTAHTGDTDIHVTTGDKEKWNAAEDNAKAYASGYTDAEVLKVNNALTAYTATTDATLESIESRLTAITSNAVTSVDSSANTINVSNTDGAVNVEVNTLSVADAQSNGYVALEKGNDGALYGVMYYGGDDAE
jgi:hypothetical protein